MTIHSTLFKALVSAGLLAASAVSSAATINVTTTFDKPIDYNTLEANCLEGKGLCSLRDAVELANQLVGADTIKLPAGLYKLSRVGKDEDNNDTGDLDIKSDITLQGVGAKQTIVDGNLTDRIFHHHQGALVIDQVTLQHGKVKLTYDQNNPITNTGGAIYSEGAEDTLVIKNSILQANQALHAAAIYYESNDILMIKDSAIKNHKITNGSNYYRAAITYFGPRFIMRDSVYQSNEVGMIVHAEKAYVIDSKLMSNNIMDPSEDSVLEIFCENNAEIRVKNTSMQYNTAGKIVEVGTINGGSCFDVDIEQVYLTNNLSWSVLDIRSGGLIASHFSVKNLTIADNEKLEPIGNYTENSAPIHVDAYGNSSTFDFDQVAVVNNDYTPGLVGGISWDIGNTQKEDILTLANSTISGNKAKQYIVHISGYDNSVDSMVLLHTTIANNQLTFPAYGSLRTEGAGKIELVNSLLADTKNCYNYSNIVSLGNNLATDYSCLLDQVTDLVGEDPKLLPLNDNGGSTLTHALPLGSPAIDAGNNELGIDYDQRGKSRPYGGGVDIGAYERSFSSRPVAIDPWFKDAD